MTVGLGSGTTAYWFTQTVGHKIKVGMELTAVATSNATAALARSLEIPLKELGSHELDIAVDGADQIDSQLRLIKGGGGAMVRERIVAAAARGFVVIADESKLRPQLHGPLPVEILEFGWGSTLRLLAALGAPFRLRVDGSGRQVRSDSGNLIADGMFQAIEDPEGLAQRLDAVPGVVGHGLFLGMADLVLIGAPDGTVRELRPER